MPVHQSHTVQQGTSRHTVFVFAAKPDGSAAVGLDPRDGRAAYARIDTGATLVALRPGEIGSFSAGSFTEVDAELLPGVYSFDVPAEALSAGSTEAVLMIRFPEATVDPVKFNLVAYDPQDGWSLGMTQLQDYKRHQVLRQALPRFTEMELALGRDNEQALADRLGESPPEWALDGGA